MLGFQLPPKVLLKLPLYLLVDGYLVANRKSYQSTCTLTTGGACIVMPAPCRKVTKAHTHYLVHSYLAVNKRRYNIFCRQVATKHPHNLPLTPKKHTLLLHKTSWNSLPHITNTEYHLQSSIKTATQKEHKLPLT